MGADGGDGGGWDRRYAEAVHVTGSAPGVAPNTFQCSVRFQTGRRHNPSSKRYSLQSSRALKQHKAHPPRPVHLSDGGFSSSASDGYHTPVLSQIEVAFYSTLWVYNCTGLPLALRAVPPTGSIAPAFGSLPCAHPFVWVPPCLTLEGSLPPLPTPVASTALLSSTSRAAALDAATHFQRVQTSTAAAKPGNTAKNQRISRALGLPLVPQPTPALVGIPKSTAAQIPSQTHRLADIGQRTSPPSAPFVLSSESAVTGLGLLAADVPHSNQTHSTSGPFNASVTFDRPSIQPVLMSQLPPNSGVGSMEKSRGTVSTAVKDSGIFFAASLVPPCLVGDLLPSSSLHKGPESSPPTDPPPPFQLCISPIVSSSMSVALSGVPSDPSSPLPSPWSRPVSLVEGAAPLVIALPHAMPSGDTSWLTGR